MRIRNDTHEPLVVALRDIEDYDDLEERLEPGETYDLGNNLEDEDVITIEYPKEPVFVSEMKINGN